MDADYRKADHPFPAAIQDAEDILSLCESRPVFLSNIFLSGFSTGGNIAFVTATQRSADLYHPLQSNLWKRQGTKIKFLGLKYMAMVSILMPRRVLDLASKVQGLRSSCELDQQGNWWIVISLPSMIGLFHLVQEAHLCTIDFSACVKPVWTTCAKAKDHSGRLPRDSSRSALNILNSATFLRTRIC